LKLIILIIGIIENKDRNYKQFLSSRQGRKFCNG